MNTLVVMAVNDAWRRLLGLGPQARPALERAHLYFAGGLPAKAALVVILVGAVWFGRLYWLDGTRPGLWIKAPLLALRLIVVCTLLAMLMQPMLRLERIETIRANAVVLLDDSGSMQIRDRGLPRGRAAPLAAEIGIDPKTATRAEVAERVLSKSGVVAELAKRYNVRVYRFASDAQPVSLPAGSAADPASRSGGAMQSATTQIGSALKRALDDLTGQPIAGLLLVTDGGNNQGEDPVEVARRAKEQKVRITAVGIGDPTPTRDIAITEVLSDQVVIKDSGVQVYAGIAHRGYEGRSILLTLKRGNTALNSQRVTLGASSRKQTVTFNYTPRQEGQFSYSVSTDLLPDEIDKTNNQRPFLQRVTARKLQVLYVEGEPRWEYRYLKNAILRDKQIQLACILTSASQRTAGEGNKPIYAFPQDEKALFDYDILILGDVPRSYFSDGQMRNIRRFVEDKGGSLLVLCGEKHMPHEYKASSLDAIFPVVPTSGPDPVKTVEPFNWELTQEGRQDPILRLSDDPAENQQIWQTIPGMYYNAGVERARPGATVLAVNPARTNAYGKRILLAVQSFGAGRCLLSTVDSTWRWRWRVGDKHFYRFWGQVIRTLTPRETAGGNRFAQINTDRTEYNLAERVSVHARLLDSFYHPIKAKQVVAILQGETGAPTRITLTAIPGTPGLFSGDFQADRVGKFTLALDSTAGSGTKASGNFLVQATDLENQQPEMNEALLKKIAATTGGAYYRPEDIRKWLDTLKANDLTIRSESEIELWDAPFFLLAFIVPLALEWLIRKRTGLL